jgi:hypothetical protein
VSVPENKPPEDERQDEQQEQERGKDPADELEDALHRLIKEGSEEEIRRADVLMSILTKSYAIQGRRAEAQAQVAQYLADREVAAMREGLKLRFQAYKNLTVLGSGALVAFAVITHNLTTDPRSRALLLSGAYAAVLVSLAASLTMMFVLSFRLSTSGPRLLMRIRKPRRAGENCPGYCY